MQGAGDHRESYDAFSAEKVNELTKGKSLASNLELVYNNARVAAQIACSMASMQNAG